MRITATPARAKPCQWVRGQAHHGARVFADGKRWPLAQDASFRLLIPCQQRGVLRVRIIRSDGSEIVHLIRID